MAVSYNPSIVKNGLVLYYDFGNIKKGWKVEPAPGSISASNIVDLSGNENGCNFPNCDESSFSSSNYGYVFFDAGDPDDLPTKLTTQFNDFSASVWFRPNGITTPSFGKLIEKLGSNGFSILRGTPSTSWGFGLGNSQTSFFGANGIVDGAWNMITITSRLVSTTRTTKLFFNNASKTSSTITSSQLSNAPMIIGNSSDCNYPYEGDISMVMIYNRALEDEEVYSNYNATKGRFGL